jgi:4-amino-4-deoxychorismate lyase
VLGPGDVLALQPDSIHSVINETGSVTVSLHVYGKHVNHTERSQFDPEQHKTDRIHHRYCVTVRRVRSRKSHAKNVLRGAQVRKLRVCQQFRAARWRFSSTPFRRRNRGRVTRMPASTTSFKVLSPADVLARLEALRARQKVNYWAFYSSQLGGVVSDPALMVVPFDDHMVHRGHGIFDTAGLVNGKIYDLEAHLDRFERSAERSKLRLAGSRDEMRDIIVKTTAASGRRDGSIRYWLSSGPGSLELSPAAGAEPGFFVMIFPGLAYPERFYTEGVRVMTTTYPIKPPLYAITKTTNYLPNVLMQMEAKEAGFDNGVFLDAAGYLGESSNMNVAFVSEDGVFEHPRFDHILSGCTSLRLLELAPRLRDEGLLKGVTVRDIPVDAALRAREMLLIGSSVKVAPIVQWDQHRIGDGKPGPVAKALLHVLEEDMRTGDRLLDVPY